MTPKQRPIVTDICWTLYYSNTTFDFLDNEIHHAGYIRLRAFMKNFIVRKINSCVLKIIHKDVLRAFALHYLHVMTAEEITAAARRFVHEDLAERKIEASWQIISGREIIIASGTIKPIADAVSEEIGAKIAYSGDIYKKDASKNLKDFDIITDNLSDLPLIKRAKKAYIITYSNRNQWGNLGLDNIEFIADGKSKY